MTVTCITVQRVLGTLATILLAQCAALQAPAANELPAIRIGGTGMALEAMRLLGDDYRVTDPNLADEILPSLGTPGGIKALMEGEIEVAVAARRPNPQELAKGVQSAMCLNTALVFASSHATASGVAMSDLPSLYSDVGRKWPDGTPIKIILRARAGSENGFLVRANPEMASVLENAYKRPGMPVGATDQQNADLATRTAGSLALMSLLQVRAERLKLKVLPLNGIAATEETLQNGTYPMLVELCLLIMANGSPSVGKFISHVRSASALDRLSRLGAVRAK